MRLLLTGSTGYIGRHVLRCLDLNISIFAPKRNELDLLNKKSIIDVITTYRPTHCLHLAWNTTGNYAQSDINLSWLEYGKILIEHFYTFGGQRFIGIGTCYEYEDKYIPHTEYEPISSPNTIYGRSKLALQRYLSEYALKNKISWAWARPFFITGPEEKTTRFVPSLIKNMRQGNEFLVNSPERFLDYMDVRDVATALCRLLCSRQCGVFNLSSSHGITLADMANMIMKLGKFSGKLIFGNEKQDPMYCVGDNLRMVELLAFSPKYNLKTTLSDTIKDLIKE